MKDENDHSGWVKWKDMDEVGHFAVIMGVIFLVLVVGQLFYD